MKLHNYIIDFENLGARYQVGELLRSYLMVQNPLFVEYPNDVCDDDDDSSCFPSMRKPVKAGYRSDLEDCDHRGRLTDFRTNESGNAHCRIRSS